MTGDSEQCGFCSKGIYSWNDGRRGPCPYCGGSGKQVPPADRTKVDRG